MGTGMLAASSTENHAHPNLGELFDHYGTDKTRSGYAGIYEDLYEHRRHEVTRVLEIGIGTLLPAAPSSMLGYAAPHYRPGGSLRAWRDYFPNATIWGIDTQHDTQFNEHRITTTLADSTNPAQLRRVLDGLDFDLIIDDGAHDPLSQVKTLNNLWSYRKPDGWYIIEDILGEPELGAILACAKYLGTAVVGPHRNLLAIS